MVHPRFLLPAVAVALACAALAAHAQTHPAGSATQVLGSERGGLSEADREFFENAAHAGHAEVQASRLALEKATDPDVKAFAQRMIDDHTQAHERLEQLAQVKGVKLPGDPAIAQKAKLQLLGLADGQDFDERYVDDFGVEAHRNTIELFDRQLAQGKDAQLIEFARRTLPTLQQHLQAAQQLQRSVLAAGATSRGATAPKPNEGETAREAPR